MSVGNVVTLGFGPGASGVAFIPTIGFGAAVPAPPTPEPEPTPTPAPTPTLTVRAGAGQNIMEMRWYDDKPWIRARDREVAKAMREAAEDNEKERGRRQRRRAEAIAVVIMMLGR